MGEMQGTELRRGSNLLVADHGKDLRPVALSLERKGSCLQERRAALRPRRGVGDQDIEAYVLAAGFDTRRNIHRIAHRRIVEACLRAHIADTGETGMDADAYPHLPGAAETESVLSVEFVKRLAHGKCRPKRLCRMIGNIDRRIPEGHDGIADEFIE